MARLSLFQTGENGKGQGIEKRKLHDVLTGAIYECRADIQTSRYFID